MTDTAVRPGQTASAHPLDPATAAEYLAGREIMAAAGLLAEPVRFAYYGLEEPPKDDVLTGQPADRRLRAFLVNTATGESTDVVVSLTDARVIIARTLDPPADGQMPILDSDFALVDEIVKADPGWRAAMARRGLHDVSQIRACPITAGEARRIPARTRRARQARVAVRAGVDGPSVLRVAGELEVAAPASAPRAHREPARDQAVSAVQLVLQPVGNRVAADGHAGRPQLPAAQLDLGELGPAFLDPRDRAHERTSYGRPAKHGAAFGRFHGGGRD